MKKLSKYPNIFSSSTTTESCGPQPSSNLFRKSERARLIEDVKEAEKDLTKVKKKLELFDINTETNGLLNDITKKINGYCEDVEQDYPSEIYDKIIRGLLIVNPPMDPPNEPGDLEYSDEDEDGDES